MDSIPLLISALDLTSAVAFAMTGALVASRKQMDIVGFVWLAVITGVGGGTFRDLLLDVPVFWMVDPQPVMACIVTAIVLHFTAHIVESRYRWILWLDAGGMALVTIAGTSKAMALGAGPVVSVAMGVITASLGGIIRDVIGQEPSIVMRREIYVSASLAGAISYVLLAGYSTLLAAAIGFGVALLIRLTAIQAGWSLPVYRSTPGRSPEDIP